MDSIKMGRYIKAKRKEKNLTQEALAELLMVDRKTISKWENAVYLPDISMISELAQIFEVNENNIINGYDSKELKKKFTLKPLLVFMFIFFILIGTNNNCYAMKFYDLKYTNNDISIDANLVTDTKSYIFELNHIDVDFDYDYVEISCGSNNNTFIDTILNNDNDYFNKLKHNGLVEKQYPLNIKRIGLDIFFYKDGELIYEGAHTFYINEITMNNLSIDQTI